MTSDVINLEEDELRLTVAVAAATAVLSPPTQNEGERAWVEGRRGNDGKKEQPSARVRPCPKTLGESERGMRARVGRDGGRGAGSLAGRALPPLWKQRNSRQFGEEEERGRGLGMATELTVAVAASVPLFPLLLARAFGGRG